MGPKIDINFTSSWKSRISMVNVEFDERLYDVPDAGPGPGLNKDQSEASIKVTK